MSTSVIFHWMGPENQRLHGEGATRDVSVEGVFVLTKICPPENTLLQMEVILPLSDGASKAQMKADMRVVRVDRDVAGNSRSGFSAVGKGFSLKTLTDRTPGVVIDLNSKPSTRESE